METQRGHNWCWAAVAVSLHKFLDPGKGNWTQESLATKVLFGERQILKGVDCATTPGLCDITAALDDALAITGNLMPNGFLLNQHLTFAGIKTAVDARLPVAARITWFGGGAHFIAIDGYREFDSGDQLVHVLDPDAGPSYQNYNDLVEVYSAGGNWQDTYLVQKSGASKASLSGAL